MKSAVEVKKGFSSVVTGTVLTVSLAIGGSVFAAGQGGTPLPVQDATNMVTTIVDKSVIEGSLAYDEFSGDLLYDERGYARFVYSGKVYAVETDDTTGELKKMSDDPIGDITGEAAFPKDFVALSAGVNALMQQMMDVAAAGGDPMSVPMPQMPAVVPWTCNHCLMNVAGTTYVSIVDVLDPDSEFYSEDMADKFDAGLMGAFDEYGNPVYDEYGNPVLGSAVAKASMGMEGRAFTGLTPASFNPMDKTISVRMAGCSALVAIAGPHAGKVGTLCMNSTATFDVSGAKPIFDMSGDKPKLIGYEPDSRISAKGTSNCVTVLHTPTM